MDDWKGEDFRNYNATLDLAIVVAAILAMAVAGGLLWLLRVLGWM